MITSIRSSSLMMDLRCNWLRNLLSCCEGKDLNWLCLNLKLVIGCSDLCFFRRMKDMIAKLFLLKWAELLLLLLSLVHEKVIRIIEIVLWICCWLNGHLWVFNVLINDLHCLNSVFYERRGLKISHWLLYRTYWLFLLTTWN